MADRIIPRHDTKARWAEVNPILMEGEWGIVIDDLSLYKVGDGFTAWNDLPFRGYNGNIVEIEGNSTESVMSQNAVSTRLASANANITKLQTDVADRYTKQEVDAKEKKLREDVDAEYAKKDGAYPKFTAGFAENIVGDGSATPEVFSFRPTAGEERNVENTTILYDGAKNGEAKIKVLKGNSVVHNQLSTQPQSSFTIAAADNEKFRYIETRATFPVGTKCFVIANYEASENTVCSEIGVGLSYYSSFHGQIKWIYFTEQKGVLSGIIESLSSANNTIVLRAVGLTNGSIKFSNVRCVNLTKKFCAGNEPTTVEEFYQRMPIGVDINAYNGGEIIDGNYGALKTTGYNQWDEQWEEGSINGGTGNNVGYSKGIRSVNYIPALANTKYFFHVGRTCSITVCCYDNKYNFLGSIAWGAAINRAYTTLPNTRYIRVATYSSSGVDYGNVYQNDICISLAWSEYADMRGTYLPYKAFERDLSWIKKYFLNGMRSAGSAHDEIRFNSTTQKWEAVQNVGVRAYAEGDTKNAEVITDGTNTNYPLSTPIVTETDENINMNFDCADYGTEELIVAEGEKSAPLSAEIIYQPNAVQTLKQVPDILRRLNALESAMAQQTTNVAPSNIEE